jgi:hypothetical protein
MLLLCDRLALMFLSRHLTLLHRPGSTKKPVLHTITYSHFVERVRWAMLRVGFEYEEQQSAGIMGLIMQVQPSLHPRFYFCFSTLLWFLLYQARTVPRLEIFSTGTVLGSSDDILTYLWAHNQE